MTYEVKGYLTIDAEDYCGEIEVHTDVRGILELMEHNDISTDEVLNALGDMSGVVMDDVLNFISVDADHSQLYQIVMASFERIQQDYTNVHQQFDAQRIRQAQTQVAMGGTSYVS
jgi:Mg/Co/Ni transporter MgtE